MCCEVDPSHHETAPSMPITPDVAEAGGVRGRIDKYFERYLGEHARGNKEEEKDTIDATQEEVRSHSPTEVLESPN